MIRKVKKWIFRIDLMYPDAYLFMSVFGLITFFYLVGYLSVYLEWPFSGGFGSGWVRHIFIFCWGIIFTVFAVFTFLCAYLIIDILKKQVIKIYRAWKNPVPTIIPKEVEDFATAGISTLSDCLDFICNYLIFTVDGECYSILKNWQLVDIDKIFESLNWDKFVRLQLEKFGMAVVLQQNMKMAIISINLSKAYTRYNVLVTKDISVLCDDNAKAEREDMITKAEQEHERIKRCNHETGTTGR